MPSSLPNPSKANIKQTHLVVKETSGLLKFLLAHLPGKSRTTVKSLLSHRQVAVDHQTVTHFDYPLESGQTVTITYGRVPEETKYRGLRIMSEDPYLIVIEKEAGMLSIATAKEKILTTYSMLSAHVKGKDPSNRIFVIHRLDRDTSGVMVFAKSEEVQSVMQKSWQDAVIERTYVAVVEGEVEQEVGTIRSYLKENKALVMYSTQNPEEGDEAVTHYKVLKRSPEYTLLEVNLETGRKNQIRVHMKDIGHPIVGDKKYGSRQNPIGRAALHARVLSFTHPVTRKVVKYETAIPQKFLALFRENEKK
jgi:23S rRNA pseudouridine1911/1915/1917 synthase